DGKDGQVSQGFIQLCRVPRNRRNFRKSGVIHIVYKLKGPGYVGRITDNFTVHEVSESNEGSPNSNRCCHAVENPEYGFMNDVSGIEPQGNHQGNGTTVAGQS